MSDFRQLFNFVFFRMEYMGKLLFLENEQSVVCQLLSNVLFGKEIHISANVDFQKVVDCASKQAITTPAFLRINEYDVDADLKQKVFNDLISQTSSIAQNYFHHQYLHDLMKKNNIPYCIMKGVASSRYYPSSMIRQMGDVDFIVKTEDLKKVDQILKEDGFHCWNMKHRFHEVYTKDNMHFELHFDFGGMPKEKDSAKVREVLKDFFEQTRKINLDGFTFVVPNDFYHGLIMLMHTQKHLKAEGFGLRHLCDWAVFINRLDDFEALFKEKLQFIGLWKYASLLSKACAIAFDLEVKPYMSKDDELAKALLKDIFDGGNFGANNNQRIYESMFITDSDHAEINQPRILQFFSTLNAMTNTHWPLAKKIPLLYVYGWFFFPLRRVFRILLGKRKPVNVKDAYINSRERKELYDKIELYR